MQIQTVFRAGNSDVIAIPKHLSDELGLKTGQKVVVDKSQDGEGVIIKKMPKKNKKIATLKTDTEFKKWLDVFMKENGEILDELADR